MKTFQLFLIFLAITISFAQEQTQKLVLGYPAHTEKIQSEAGGSVSGNLRWQGQGAILSICLLRAGSDLSSQVCKHRFSVDSGNRLAFSYDASVKSTFFLRVDADSFGSSEEIKYTIEYSCSYPLFTASKTLGISRDKPQNIIAYLNAELSSSYQYTLSSPQENIRNSLEVKLKSPAGAITTFTATKGEKKCFLDIQKEAGQWRFELTQDSLFQSTQPQACTSLTLSITKSAQQCQTRNRLGQYYSSSSSSSSSSSDSGGAAAGGVIGSVLCLVILICLCCKKKEETPRRATVIVVEHD